ncbi:MAG: HPr kinase/phosphorylase [Limimaricola soesokkakensis]|uniref:HPr kinase/phosphorylase n=1 Tax=Limimaricola soesokkakensis TaxID=1343159 RepID=UPI004059A8B5
MTGTAPLSLHASCVAWQGRGVLITGPSGSGKSALALELMAYGCDLVADDRTLVYVGADGGLRATCPAAIAGLIEARGVGLLEARPTGPAAPCLAVALDRSETERLPPKRCVTYLGCSLPLLHNIGTGHFAPAILQYLKAGRREP